MGSPSDHHHHQDLRRPLLPPSDDPPPSLSPKPTNESSDELESILSDTTKPFLGRLRPALWIELRLLFHLAAPAVIVYMINYLMSMSTQIASGHLGNLELAAASLGNNAGDGECGGDPVRASVRSAEVRNAGDISAAVNDTSDVDRNNTNGGVCVLGEDTDIPGGVGGDSGGGGGVHIRADAADIRVRRELPDPEVSAGAEHSGAERVHFGGDAGGAHRAELGGGVLGGAGAAGGFAGAELVVVDNSGGSVRVHCEEREVSEDLGRVQFRGVFGVVELLPAVGGLRRHALLGDLVLPDSRPACWAAGEPRVGS
ncbi:hypothetical protein TIFTF001_027254 [Ficus carica]|uniref:Uncharacterized protein n=1 Tax=Ficus carica TaxID=3494 RepID=A0AA88DMP4_FICCA|nr:hypothetical protein TIFTF001_027254 [Ficus carica]